MKSEPETFSFADLLTRPEQREKWDGVRNYQARNFMMQDMQVGDQVLFYHSNAHPSGIAGLAEIVLAATPDETAWDKNSPYFDPKSSPENPRWFAVTVGHPKLFSRFVSLEELRKHKELSNLLLLRKGQRLSILPLSKEEFSFILDLSRAST